VGPGQAVRAAVGGEMTGLYLVGTIISLALLIYLLIALLKPELF